MLAATYDKLKRLKITDVPVPEINNDEALLKINVCGVCGSDLVKMKSNLVSEGTVLGHEVVGTIVEIGRHIKTWSVGQKVVVAHHVPCMGCHFCKCGNYSMCSQFKNTNITPGGFSEFIKVSREHLEQTTFLIPKGTVSDYEVALTEPLACCLRAVQRAQVSTSNLILICGLGSIGIMIGKLCIQKGAHTFGIDLFEDRITVSKEMNAIQDGILANSNSLNEWVSDKTEGRGFDTVFLASGSEKSLADSLKYVRAGGKIVIFTSVFNNEKGFPNNEIYYRELTVLGSYSPSPICLKESYQMIITGKIKLKNLITDIVKLNDLPKEIDKCFNNKSLKMMVEP
jgi:L-iditol 2-dehydrogenase